MASRTTPFFALISVIYEHAWDTQEYTVFNRGAHLIFEIIFLIRVNTVSKLLQVECVKTASVRRLCPINIWTHQKHHSTQQIFTFGVFGVLNSSQRVSYCLGFVDLLVSARSALLNLNLFDRRLVPNVFVVLFDIWFRSFHGICDQAYLYLVTNQKSRLVTTVCWFWCLFLVHK